MPGSDHLSRWAHGLGILHYLHSEGKWQATPVLGSPWHHWGHPPRSSQDVHCGGSHSWIHTLLLLHKVGCLPWILVNHPWPGVQPAYNIQQPLWKILFPPTSLWPCLFPRHLPEVDQILKECQGCIRITDNITLHGQTEVEHDAHLRNLMWIAHKYDLVFNPQKTHVKAQAVNFFGCLYDADDAHPDPGKVDAIHTLLAPTNITELQEFLGLVTYLSPFIPGLSTLTAPLHELLKKDTDFTWSCTYYSTFQQVKEAVVSDTTLRYFDPSLPVTIQVNASQVGLGAALQQNGKPMAFASKALTELNAGMSTQRERERC